MTRPKTVLVVDDHEAHRKVLELVLGAHRYEVLTAEDGFEALEVLAHATPDALILDVQMPGMSGFDLARRVRRLERLRSVPILVMTSLDDDATRAEAEAIGAHRLLAKPIAGTDLRRALQDLFG
jgi:CheY-like chemotaxis protein